MTENFTPWMPLLVSAGVFLLLVMLASGIVAFAPKSVLEPFRRLADFAARRPLAVSSGENSRTYFLESCYHSGRYEDQSVKAVFRCGGLSLTNECKFTFVERIAEPITTERSGGQIVNPCCAVIGGTTRLKVDVLPSEFPESEINWRVVSGSGSFSDAMGREAAFVASGAEDEDVVVQVDVGDCPGRAPQFTMRNTTMHEVKIYPCAISVAGEPPPITEAQINSMLEEVNVIFRQVGMHFSLGASLMCVTNETWTRDGLVVTNVGVQIRNIIPRTDGLEVYFIEGRGWRREPLGQFTEFGIILRKDASAKTLAHEIGHACGWVDIYHGPRNAVSFELMQSVRQSWMPHDWNNGTGVRFYALMLLQSELIPRLLMFGYGGDTKSDIPAGNVHGRAKDGAFGLISVGRRSFMTTSPHSL